MLIVKPSLQIKPQLWAINPGLIWANAQRMGLPMPVFLTTPGAGWNTDHISNNMPTLLPAGNWQGVTEQGAALESTSTTTGGAYWAQGGISKIVNDLSIFIIADIHSQGDHAVLLAVPYRVDGSWAAPWCAFGFTRSVATTQGKFLFARDDTNYSTVDSDANYFILNSLTSYAMTRTGTALKFYRNGNIFSTEILSSADNIDIPANRPIHIFNRCYATQGEGTDGQCPIAIVFDVVLTSIQIATLSVDPYGLLQQPRSIWAVEGAAGSLSRDIAGSLPAMSGALTRKHYAKRPIQGAI